MKLAFPKPKRSRRKGTRTNKAGHEFLAGTKAHFWRRVEMYRRAGGDIFVICNDKGMPDAWVDLRIAACEMCGRPISWTLAQWAHLIHWRHCDCFSKKCNMLICRSCHAADHHNDGRIWA